MTIAEPIGHSSGLEGRFQFHSDEFRDSSSDAAVASRTGGHLESFRFGLIPSGWKVRFRTGSGAVTKGGCPSPWPGRLICFSTMPKWSSIGAPSATFLNGRISDRSDFPLLLKSADMNARSNPTQRDCGMQSSTTGCNWMVPKWSGKGDRATCTSLDRAVTRFGNASE